MPVKRIAIVEDEGIVALDIKKSLQFLGFEVPVVVDTANKIIARLKDTEVDLILMDVILKGDIDGIEAARIILESKKIPIVFLSAFEDESTLERATLNNTHGYLVKPFTDDKLRTVVERAFKV